MKTVSDLLTLAIISIIIFLFLNRGNTTVQIIKESGGALSSVFRTLQGRG